MVKLTIGLNNLETTHPQLAKEWHPTKNGNLKPTDVTFGSSKKVWWLLPYDDPKTGKHFDFEWQATIRNRIRDNGSCPYLSGHRIWIGFNDLATTHPQLIKEWHPTKNGKLKPTDVIAGSTQKVWWFLPYDDPKTGNHFDFEWESIINDRTNGSGCPYLFGKAVWKGFNDLETNYPHIAKEWHPTKNGDLKPTDVTFGSGKKVWWLYPYDDPKTGKHFDFEWISGIRDRTINNQNCPYLCGKLVQIGFNDLGTFYPQLAKEWHPTKNGKLTPWNVTMNSSRKVWWYLPYDDPNTGKHFDFEWATRICHRANDVECPYLTGHKVWKGFNDLETTHPQLAKQWHPTKNGNLKPTDVSAGSGLKVWWFLPYDEPNTGKHFDFEWEDQISNKVFRDNCPYLSGRRVWEGFNDIKSYCKQNDMEYILEEWDYNKNGEVNPTNVTVGSPRKVWWKLSYDDIKTGKHFVFEWCASIYERVVRKSGCPYLSASKLERLAYDVVKQMGLSFKAEHKFSKCKDKLPLKFDIYLKNEKKVIELDGIQHFRIIEHFGGEEKFEITKYHDEIKDNFCAEHNIPLLRIPYIYDSCNDKDEITSIIKNFIEHNTIPQKIQQFYHSEQRITYTSMIA